MRFKEFLHKEELQGLFGNPVKVNPARVDHAIEKKFHKPPSGIPSTKQRGGSDIKRMMGAQKTLSKAPLPSAGLPKQVTLQRHAPGEFFKAPKTSAKGSKVKSPLGL